MNNIKKTITSLWFLLLLSFVEAVGTIINLLLIPTDAKNSLLGGYSANRLLMMAFVLVLAIVLMILTIKTYRDRRYDGELERLLISNKRNFSAIMIGFTLVFIFCWVFSWLPSYRFGSFHLVYDRLRPLVVLATIYIAQVILWLNFKKYNWFDKTLAKDKRDSINKAEITLLVLFIGLWLIIAVSGWGITPDEAQWNDVGIPILGLQLFIAVVTGVVFYQIEVKNIRQNTGEKARKIDRLDILICICIWLFTSIIWILQPQQSSFFAPGPYSPNEQYYPFSDAAGYDIDAQFALIGQGLNNYHDVDKPLFSVFLVFLHLIGGQNFNTVVWVQVVFLAVFSVILYCIGRALHSRSAGIVAALLIIMHGVNAIASSRMILSANPKLLLSEYPTAICLALMTYFSIIWMKNPQRNIVYGMLAWGMLGLATLLRHNVWVILPLFFFLTLLLVKPGWKRKLFHLILFNLVFFMSILPWMWRTTQVMSTPLYFLGPIQEVFFKKRLDVNLQPDHLQNQTATANHAEEERDGNSSTCKFRCLQDIPGYLTDETPEPYEIQPTMAENGVVTPTPDEPEMPNMVKTPSLTYVLNDGTYDDQFVDIYYYGDGWSSETGNDYEGSRHQSIEDGDYVLAWFNGEAFEIIYAASPDGGMLDVELDGEIIGTIDQSSNDVESQLTWKSKRFEKNVHKLVLRNNGGKTVSVDGIVFHSYNSFIFPNGIEFPSMAQLTGTLMSFVPTHFIHNFVTTILTLPTSLVYDDLEHVLQDDEGVWSMDWNGSLDLPVILLITINLFILAKGLACAITRWRTAGAMPLLVFLFYSLGLAVARTSGGRYIVALEWVIYLYLALGVVQLVADVMRRWKNEGQVSTNAMDISGETLPVPAGSYPLYGAIIAAFFIIGSLPVMSEYVFPKRYADAPKEDVLQVLVERGLVEQLPYRMDRIQEFLKNENSYLWMGRALYPHYFFADQGEYNNSKEKVTDYPRLVFTMIGGSDEKAITGLLPTDQFPEYFPDASDVIVMGCRDSFTDVLAVVILDDDKGDVIYTRSPNASLSCPVREPICDDNRNCH